MKISDLSLFRTPVTPINTNNQTNLELLGLPQEIVLGIFQHLDKKSLLTISETCTQLKQIARDDSIWKLFFDNVFSLRTRDNYFDDFCAQNKVLNKTCIPSSSFIPIVKITEDQGYHLFDDGPKFVSIFYNKIEVFPKVKPLSLTDNNIGMQIIRRIPQPIIEKETGNVVEYSFSYFPGGVTNYESTPSRITEQEIFNKSVRLLGIDGDSFFIETFYNEHSYQRNVLNDGNWVLVKDLLAWQSCNQPSHYLNPPVAKKKWDKREFKIINE